MAITKICFCAFILFSHLAYAEIYKCVDDTGKIKYQSKECDDKEQSKIIKIKNPSRKTVHNKPRLKNITSPDSYNAQKNSLDRQAAKLLKKQKKQKCKMLRKRFKMAEKKVIERCKKNREVFCSLSAVQIEKKELWKALRQNRNGRGSVRTPAFSHVEILQKEYKDGCR